jgi:hypothetical protein
MTAAWEGEITFETPKVEKGTLFDHRMMDGTKVDCLVRERFNVIFLESRVWMSLERDKVALLLLTSEKNHHHFSLIVRRAGKNSSKKFLSLTQKQTTEENSNEYFWDFSKHFHSHFLVDFSFYKREKTIFTILNQHTYINLLDGEGW